MPGPTLPPMNRSASRLVVFDFDGTIADTWRDIAQALNRTLESVDLPTVHGPDVRFWIGAGVLPLLERAVPEEWKGPDRLEQLYERFREHYRRLCLETTEPYRGIPECLEQLSGEHLAIASNKPAVFLDQILVGLGLKTHFEVIVAGDTLEIRKPDPAVLEHVARSVGSSIGEVWMVGDSAVDVELGRAFGARTVGCTWGLRGRDELYEAGAEFLIDAPSELLTVMRGERVK